MSVRELIEQSKCFGMLYFEGDGSPCEFSEDCAVSIQCKKVVLENEGIIRNAEKGRPGKSRRAPKRGHLRKRHVPGRKLQINLQHLGHQFFEVLRSTLEDSGLRVVFRSQYINFLSADQIVLRAVPKVDSVLLYISEIVGEACMKYGMRIRPFYPSVAAFNKGFHYFLRIQDDNRLKRFILVFKEHVLRSDDADV